MSRRMEPEEKEEGPHDHDDHDDEDGRRKRLDGQISEHEGTSDRTTMREDVLHQEKRKHASPSWGTSVRRRRRRRRR